MGSTPEAKVKKLVNAVLDEFIGDDLAKPKLYRFWPVPSGFGASSLDCIVCYQGRFIAIETKAPGKKPTPRQDLCIRHMFYANGTVFVIDGPGQELEELRLELEEARDANHS